MAFVAAADAVRRVGEPDAAVGMDDDVVRRVQAPALETVRDDRHRAGVLVARHAPAAVLAGDLAPFVVERVAVAVAGRAAEDADVAVLLQPAHLAVVRDVAPDQVASAAVPGRPFRPQRAGVVAADRRVEEDVGPEPRVEGDDVRIRVVERGSSRPVARLVRRQARLPRGGQHRSDRRGGDRGAEERAPVQRSAGRAAGAGRRRAASGVFAHGGSIPHCPVEWRAAQRLAAEEAASRIAARPATLDDEVEAQQAVMAEPARVGRTPRQEAVGVADVLGRGVLAPSARRLIAISHPPRGRRA